MSPAPSVDGIGTLRRALAKSAREIFQPLPKETVSEWADTYRVLPTFSAVPGRFRTDFIPYMRAIQDALSDESIREVVFAKSSQVAGSTVGENFIGYLMHRAPSAILMVWPTEEKLKKWSLKRLDPMIEDTPVLHGMFPRSGRRETGDSIAYKEFPGGWLNAITAKSTTALKSDSARVAIAEEPDEWEGDIGEQGDPLELLLARLRTFWNSKLYANGTPTISKFSRIWTLLEGSTWNERWWPCPHCEWSQVLKWRDASDDADPDANESGAYRFLFERNDDGEIIDGSTRYLCEKCNRPIEERWKREMDLNGDWRPRYPGRRRVGFHIWSAYSPLAGWDDLCRAFLKSKDVPAKLKVFDNTWRGVPHRDDGEKVSSHFLSKRVEPYPKNATGERLVPRGVGLLTAGVDVQGDRLELFIWGWGAGERSWVYEWQQLSGDPGQDEVWEELDRWLTKSYTHEDGAPMRIAAACVDAGYNAERVWRFCMARSRRKVIATVGRDGRGRKLIEAPAPEKYKRSRARKRPMHVLAVDSGKDMLASRLRILKPEVPGYVHFHDELDAVFFDQLTAEELKPVYRDGRPLRKWVLPDGLRNEALDGAILNMGALAFLGMPVINRLGEYAEQLVVAGEAIRRGANPTPRPARRMISRGLHG